MKLITILLLFFGYLFQASQASGAFCSDIFSRSNVTSPEFVNFIQPRLGGTEKQWLNYVERLLQTKTNEDLVEISHIFKNTEARGWFARKTNSLLFFRLESVFSTIDALYIKNIDINSLSRWSELSIRERRALLLVGFGKWWWQVESPQVRGFGRWADAAYVVSRIIHRSAPETTLRLRLHELLADPSQTGFLMSLISRFRAEYEVMTHLKENRESREVLQLLLRERASFFKGVLESNTMSSLRRSMVQIQVLRALVLKEMLRLNRKLSLPEIEKLATSANLPKSIVLSARVGQTLQNLLPDLSPRVSVQLIAEIAAITLVAYVVSEFFWDDPYVDPSIFNQTFLEYEQNRIQTD